MRSAILLLLLATAFAAVNCRITSGGSTNEVELIGQIGSKQYYEFKNNGEKVTWMAAREICKLENLEFGSTETYEEFSYLYNQRKVDYWVSGSLKGFAESVSGTNKAFEWIDGSEIIPNDINFHHNGDDWLCMYFSGDDHTYVDFCLTGLHHVLCQQKV